MVRMVIIGENRTLDGRFDVHTYTAVLPAHAIASEDLVAIDINQLIRNGAL